MKTAEWREAFWEARRSPLIFFAVAFAVGISVNFLSSWLQDQTWAGWVFGLGVPLVLLAVIASPWIGRIWRYPEAVPVIVPQARPCKGLVVIVSRGPGSGSAKAAIEYHAESLQRVWVVHSESSAKEAAAVVQAVCEASARLTRGHFLFLDLPNADFLFNPEAMRNLIEEQVYGELGDLKPEDVIVDVTGGTKAASVGASLAGLPRARRLEVVRFGAVDDQGRATSAGDPFEIRMDYKLKPLRRR